MTRPRPLVTGLGAALALTLVLGGCNAMRDQVGGPPRDEDGVAITRVVRDAVAEALPDAEDTTATTRLDGFANTMMLTVTWPDEVELDVAAVQDGARAICEHVEGYDYVEYGFYLPGAEHRVDLTDLWAQAFPDNDAARDSVASISETDCAVILA